MEDVLTIGAVGGNKYPSETIQNLITKLHKRAIMTMIRWKSKGRRKGGVVWRVVVEDSVVPGVIIIGPLSLSSELANALTAIPSHR